MNVSDLESHIDESIRIGHLHGYYPTTFQKMRERHTTVGAIERLLISANIQTGFKRLIALGLRQWTIEEAVLKYPQYFTASAQECARFRLGLLDDAART